MIQKAPILLGLDLNTDALSRIDDSDQLYVSTRRFIENMNTLIDFVRATATP